MGLKNGTGGIAFPGNSALSLFPEWVAHPLQMQKRLANPTVYIVRKCATKKYFYFFLANVYNSGCL